MAHTKKAQATRQRIVSNAANLISRQGFCRTRLEEVLRESGVQKGNFYYYFRSKDELALAVMAESLLPMAQEWLSGLLPATKNVWSDMQAFVKNLLSALDQDIDQLSPLQRLEAELCEVDPASRDQIALSTNAIAAIFNERFRPLQGSLPQAHAARNEDLGLFWTNALRGALGWFCVSRDRQQLETSLLLTLAGLRAQLSD